MFDQQEGPQPGLSLRWPALWVDPVYKLTDWTISDPPSSCSAGPQGDDLVNIHVILFRRSETNIKLVPLASDNHGTGTKIITKTWLNSRPLILLPGRFSVPGRRLFPFHPLSHRLPIQASQGQLHHPHLPPEYQLQRLNLLGHSARPMVASIDYLERFVKYFTDLETGLC